MSKEHILLVEDEPEFVFRISLFNFESEGYKVSKLNGEELMKLLEKMIP